MHGDCAMPRSRLRWVCVRGSCSCAYAWLVSPLSFPFFAFLLSLCLRVCELLRIDGSASYDGLLHSSFLLHERGHYMKARTQRRLFAARESMNMFILFYLLAYDVFPTSFFVLRVCVYAPTSNDSYWFLRPKSELPPLALGNAQR